MDNGPVTLEYADHPRVPGAKYVRIGDAVKVTIRLSTKNDFQMFVLTEVRDLAVMQDPSESWGLAEQFFYFSKGIFSAEMIFQKLKPKDA